MQLASPVITILYKTDLYTLTIGYRNALGVELTIFASTFLLENKFNGCITITFHYYFYNQVGFTH